MNIRLVSKIVGIILLCEAGLMVAPVLVGLIYRETGSMYAFLITMAVTALAGLLLVVLNRSQARVYQREGFVIVTIGWFLISVFGCVPFVISGSIPDPVDAFFETISGFTTTGASILTDVESLSHAMLFWRSFTHWIGGMGVLAFIMILTPLLGSRNNYLLQAETPGPESDRLVPKARNSVKILYGIYFGMTLILIVLLCAGGMSLFDSLIHSFGTAGTGGFSNYSDSVGHFHSAYIEIVIGIFMLLFGVNFKIHYYLLLKRKLSILKNEELLTYIIITCFATVTIAAGIFRMFPSGWEALRASFFQVSSILTTTGYSTVDFDLWPQYPRTLLLGLMLVGACAGSTGGGFKVARLVLIAKAARRGMMRMVHPRAVKAIQMEGKKVDEQVISNVSVYLILYLCIMVVSVIILSLDSMTFEENLSAVTACFNNIGPAYGSLGPAGNYSGLSVLSKLILSIDMLAGRLEIIPLMILLLPGDRHLRR
ncbi:MAG: TrkH family potassium uptake protein [Firmicutes bacterium]|nr:TrkH family potassium uptake protein [Bacillota bacterium]